MARYCSSRTLLAKLACAAALLLASSPSVARVLGADLRGDELLVEFERVGDATEPAGIYALSPDAEWRWQRVIADGRRPRWSPDHRRFLFWHGGELEIADLDTGRRGESGWRGTTYDGDCQWLPAGEALVGRRTQFVPGLARLAVGLARVPVSGDSDSEDLWRVETAEIPGRYGFSPDAQRVVYESIDLVPNLGRVSSKLVLRDLTTGLTRTAPTTHGTPVNPHWQPGGELIAYDAVDLTTRVQRSLLWDPRTDQVTLIGPDGDLRPPGSWGHAERWTRFPSTEIVSWSPDGQSLLILHHGVPPQLLPVGPVLLYVVPLDADAPVVSWGGTDGLLVSASWSPDGRYVAYIRQNGLDPWASRFFSLGIRSVSQEDVDFHERSEDYPPGLVPVWLDW